MKQSSTTFLILILLSACFSPSKLLQSGKYKKAVNSALYKIENKREVGQNLDILNEAMRHYLEQETQEVNELLGTGDINDGEKAFDKRKEMLELMEKAEPYLDRDLANYLPELRSLTEELNEELYNSLLDWGKEDLSKYYIEEDKSLARDAYHYFRKAQKYTIAPGQLDTLIDLSIEMAKVVYYVESDAGFSGYSWEIDNKFEDLAGNKRFSEIIYDRGDQSRADCLIEIEFDDPEMEESTSSNEEVFTTDVVKGTKIILNDEGEEQKVNIWEEVSGKVITHSISRKLTWTLELDIRANSKHCDLRDKEFSAEMEVEKVEYQLHGDLRAIPEEYQEELDDPDIWEEEDFVDDLLDDLYELVKNYLN